MLFASANAYNPAENVEDNWESTYSTALVDQRVNNPKIDTEVEEYGANDDSYRKRWEDNRAGKVREKETWFVDVEFLGCSEPRDYVCPPLKDMFLNQGYRSRINYIDLKNGKISCSVLPPLDENQFLTTRSETSLYTNVYENKGCIEKYSTSSNVDTSEEVENLKKENEDFIESLNQQEYKYTVDYKKSGDEEFLDFADILDNLVTFNPNIFDLESTLLTRDLKTMPGYTTLPNETIITKLEQQLKSFTDIISGNGFSSDRFFEEADKQAKIRDLSNVAANSSFLMLLDYYIKANDAMVLLAQSLAFIFIVYNGIFTWIIPTLTNKMQKKDSGENSPQRGLFGIIALIMLFAGDIERFDIQYESKTDGTIKSELVLQQTNIQAAIQFLASETNYWADYFAEIGIRSALSGLSESTGFLTGNQVQALATERMILKKEKEALSRIETDMCYANYDVKLIKDKLAEYRTKTLNENTDTETSINVAGFISVPFFSTSVSELKQNPFPKTEREANAMLFYSKDKKKLNTSPYNPNYGSIDSGVVKFNEKDKFRTGYYSPLSLSGCYNNNKKMTANDQRLREIETQFEQFSSISQKNAKAEYLRVISEIQWGLFAKQGYMAMAYVPVTQMLVENLGIVGDLKSQQDALEEATGSSEGVANDIMVGTIQGIAEDIPFLAIMGGYNIARVIHPIKEFLIDGFVNGIDTLGNFLGPIGKGMTFALTSFLDIKNAIPFGEDENQIDIFDLKIAAFLIKNLFTTLITVTLVTGSVLLFTLLVIEKLFAFISSMFLLIYAFAKNQEERMSTAFAKIIAVYAKTILIVVCIFLSMYSLNLVNTLEMLFIESFFKSMDMIENASWDYAYKELNLKLAFNLIILFFKKYIFFGVSKFAFMVLKLVLVVQMIWKMPGYMYELIYEKVHSVSDSVSETLQNANEAQTMRV
ncbi:hypothetical protein CRV06_08610 [Halarcobacter anaerophilus]|uniref:Uncharacterized protein n=2 Tax=Halarcobacter anaerophilus TaxID=877500 RepID=A0A4Q0XYW6_9BACT|nr:hypothetical protein CRV06_08610 [Halarcobacter anaerophilus]